ncbi:MAG TPA: hypothetical protein VGG75_39745 [Trebonia sp.]
MSISHHTVFTFWVSRLAPRLDHEALGVRERPEGDRRRLGLAQERGPARRLGAVR